MDRKEILRKMRETSKSDDVFLERANMYKNKLQKGLVEGSTVGFEEEVKEILSESILDPVNETRCKELFDENDVILDKARNQILAMVKGFQEASKVKFEIKALYLIGSSTGFQYTPTSDIDIAIISTQPKNTWKENWMLVPKGVHLEGTEKPINCFIIYNEDEYDFKVAENVYDVQNKKWLKKVPKTNIRLPYSYILGLSKFFMDGCDTTLGQFKRDKKEFQRTMMINPKAEDISENELAEALDKIRTSIRIDADSLRMAHHVIFAFEQEGYEDKAFKLKIEIAATDDPHYTSNNLVYKMLDSLGYLEEIDAASKECNKIIREIDKKIKELGHDKPGER